MSTDDLARELLCGSCHREYVCWFAPNEIWNAIMRDASGNESQPFLCPTCFTSIAEARGIIPIAWRIAPEDVTFTKLEIERDKLQEKAQLQAELIECLDKLCAAYRVGARPGEWKVLDKIAPLRKSIADV